MGQRLANRTWKGFKKQQTMQALKKYKDIAQTPSQGNQDDRAYEDRGTQLIYTRTTDQWHRGLEDMKGRKHLTGRQEADYKIKQEVIKN